MGEKPLWDRILPIMYAFPPGDARGLAIRGLSNEAKALEEALSTSRARDVALELALREILNTYCLHVCHQHDDECDLEPEEHSANCINARAALSPKGGGNG